MNSRTDTADTGPALSLALPGDYVQLMKPRVMSLVLFTALVGMALAPAALHPLTGFTALLCIAAGAGASGALNMWYDADIDAIMSRTAGRPVPQGRVTPGEALGFGLTLSVFSVFTMGVLVNWLAAGLLAFTIFFYAVVYTMWLKRRTAQNIVIGGLAGALPPAVGWAAAAESLSLTPLVLVALIFLWTPAHFWALALYRCEDYARARVPMLPVTSGEAATRVQILLYTVLTVAASALPLVLGFAAYVYMAAAVLGGALFLALAAKVAAGGKRPREAAQRDAMRLFGFSILYLFALFAALLIEAMLHLAPGAAA